MVTDNESFIRCTDDLVGPWKVCVENGFEIISFVIDRFGSWVVTFYVYINHF